MKKEWKKPDLSCYSTTKETLGTWRCNYCWAYFNTKEGYEAHLTKHVTLSTGASVGDECPDAPDDPSDYANEDYTRIS